MQNQYTPPAAFGGKRYYSLYEHLKHKFPVRIGKAVIEGGFSCPNIDGTRGSGGCRYCTGASSVARAYPPITAQCLQELQRIRKKWPSALAIAYFQNHTNTYAPLPRLKALYEEALTVPGICGLSIGTRADCLSPALISYLAELSRRTDLTVELGLQTIHDEIARRINRCHTLYEFSSAYKALTAAGIRICVHLINGLPGESEEMMLESARFVASLRPGGLKLHLLHILEGSSFAEDWRAGKIQLMEKETYISLVCSQLELLPPQTVIERLTGDGDRRLLLAPRWSRDKISVLGGIDKELIRRGSWQGKYFAGTSGASNTETAIFK